MQLMRILIRRGKASIIIKLWEQISISQLTSPEGAAPHKRWCPTSQPAAHLQPHIQPHTTPHTQHTKHPTPHHTHHATHPVPCYTSSCSPRFTQPDTFSSQPGLSSLKPALIEEKGKEFCWRRKNGREKKKKPVLHSSVSFSVPS